MTQEPKDIVANAKKATTVGELANAIAELCKIVEELQTKIKRVERIARRAS
jgi:hypothetical protein